MIYDLMISVLFVFVVSREFLRFSRANPHREHSVEEERSDHRLLKRDQGQISVDYPTMFSNRL